MSWKKKMYNKTNEKQMGRNEVIFVRKEWKISGMDLDLHIEKENENQQVG